MTNTSTSAVTHRSYAPLALQPVHEVRTLPGELYGPKHFARKSMPRRERVAADNLHHKGESSCQNRLYRKTSNGTQRRQLLLAPLGLLAICLDVE
jgi:hypothetical protein